jgi:hypothetical protein
MIAFRHGWSPNNDDVDRLIEKLKMMLGGTNTDHAQEMSVNDDNKLEDDFYSSVNLSEILNLIYQKMYKEDSEIISLIINKNENNSLDVSIDRIK